MTAPADDCGVTGGCGVCPLGRAGVCGDPVPTADDLPDIDPNEPRPADAGCCGGACGG